jgi:hypothetical protein
MFIPVGRVETNSSRRGFAVFDKSDGRLVHLHQVVVIPGAVAPADAELEADAIAVATRYSHRSPHELDIIQVAADELKQSAEYKVDLTRRILVEVARSK